MRATLTFTLPEEREEFTHATKGADYHTALFDISQEVFRPARKHGYPEANIQKLIEYLDSLAAAAAEREGIEVEQDATELVHLLECKFYDILNESGIEV